MFMEIMNHWCIIPLPGYVNNTLRQILPYRVDREMSEKHCPSIPQNFTSAICSGDKMCLYDYFTTGDTFIANHTRESSQQYSTNTDVLSKGQGFRFFVWYMYMYFKTVFVFGKMIFIIVLHSFFSQLLWPS